MSSRTLKLVIAVLLVMLVLLQYRLWVGENSMAEVWQLQKKLDTKLVEIDRLQERNQLLEAEVQELKEGDDAIEARARHELGMKKKDETFYLIVDDK